MESYSGKLEFSSSPRTPTSVLPDFPGVKCSVDCAIVSSYTPLLLPPRVKAIKKLSPIDVKRLSIHMYSHVAQQLANNINQIEESKREYSKETENYVLLVDNGEVNSDSVVRMKTEVLQPPLPMKYTVAAGDVHSTLVATPPTPPLSSTRERLLLSEASPPPPTLSPPPLMSSSTRTTTPPPPPPPPPIIASHIGTQQPPPPPTHMSTVHIVTPQLPSPPPPPPPPMAIGNVTTIGSLSAASPTSKTPVPPPPPSAPMTPKSMPQPPPSQQGKGGVAPPPPPNVCGIPSLRAKSTTKLKRSSQMGSLYRLLKGRLEGSSLDGKSMKRTISKSGTTSGGNGKQGMAEALAEMTKRSAYFVQIEEDVKTYANSINEVKAALSSFHTQDMAELIKFHKYVESHMEKLTDETQVLLRFEDFPSKKLEGLRMAAALYAKLDAISSTLQTWKIESPANQLIDKIENYFNKIKGELDTLDRTKDDELKKFKSQNIHFDFTILVRIKELMVEVSSNCMELALKEARKSKAEVHEEIGLKTYNKKAGSGKILWRAFQFAFRVYTFAGGQDDRADNLTRELAQEIQTDPEQL